MSTHSELSDNIVRHITERGISVEHVEAQLRRFKKGFPVLEIDRPATVGDGIVRIPEEDKKQLIGRHEEGQLEGRLMKFIPASGAASRMFKTLQAMLASEEKLTPSFFETHPDDADVTYTRTFLDHLESFAFYEDLVEVLKNHDLDISELRQKKDYRTLLSFVLEEKGLGLASRPKALIPFHRYSDHRRTPLEEHIVEAIAYTKSQSGKAGIHFTISPEHKKSFDERLAAVRARYESGGVRLDITTSFQKPETDTLAVDRNNRPFTDDNGNPVFRPGGHGALLANLEELQGDIVFIKNIDNVVPDRLKEVTYRYKKCLGGYLLTLQDQVFYYLRALDKRNTETSFLEEVIGFVREELYRDLPKQCTGSGWSGTTKSRSETANRLFQLLNRPIRVCGMVKNEGEPGGGPFFVRHNNGTTSLQIVESAQIDMNNPKQKERFESSTHFNPVDLVCSLRDFKGRPFSLETFRDLETGFISHKSWQGRELKALELPGLWNGSMSEWNTVFVEVPAETFQPVKTVNDLLRKEHRNESMPFSCYD